MTQVLILFLESVIDVIMCLFEIIGLISQCVKFGTNVLYQSLNHQSRAMNNQAHRYFHVRKLIGILKINGHNQCIRISFGKFEGEQYT